MSVGIKLDNYGATEDPQCSYRMLCVDQKPQVVEDIKTKINVHGLYYYVPYNLQNHREGPEARYAILLHDSTNEIRQKT